MESKKKLDEFNNFIRNLNDYLFTTLLTFYSLEFFGPWGITIVGIYCVFEYYLEYQVESDNSNVSWRETIQYYFNYNNFIKDRLLPVIIGYQSFRYFGQLGLAIILYIYARTLSYYQTLRNKHVLDQCWLAVEKIYNSLPRSERRSPINSKPSYFRIWDLQTEISKPWDIKQKFQNLQI